MSFAIEVFDPETWAEAAGRRIVAAVPNEGSVVVTGGTTAERIYPLVAATSDRDWGGLEFLFSDERCVPPDDPASNYRMVATLLFDPLGITRVHRMRGESPPSEGAAAYHVEIAPIVARGLDLVLLGMGADAHVGANFPRAPSLEMTDRLCAAVRRPDGLDGLTLTPPALTAGRRILILATGRAKAEAVRRVVAGDEPVTECPARMLADHPDVTLLLDEAAASLLIHTNHTR